MKKRRMIVLTCVCLFGLVAMNEAGGQVPRSPVRLSLKPEKGNIAVGESTDIIVQFRDVQTNFVANDRPRSVNFVIQRDSQGGGRMEPGTTRAQAGSREIRVRFTGARPGIVILQGQSEGLGPDSAFIGVLPRKSEKENPRSLWAALMGPGCAYAQPLVPPAMRLFLASDSVPANETTCVKFSVSLSAPAERDCEVILERKGVEVHILIDGKEDMKFKIRKGFITPESQAWLKPGREAGKATLTATLVPYDVQTHKELELVEPRPDRIMAEILPQNLRSSLFFGSDRAVMNVYLQDSEGALTKSEQDRVIGIRTSHDGIQPRKRELLIRKNQVSDSTEIELAGVFFQGQATVSINDKGGRLKPGEALVQVMSLTIMLLLSVAGGMIGGWLRGMASKGRKPRPMMAGVLQAVTGGVIGLLAYGGVILKIVPRATGKELQGLMGDDLSNIGAFVIGAMAGYGGKVMLDRLFEATFGAPAGKKPEKKASSPQPG